MKRIEVKRTGNLVGFIIGVVIFYFSFPYAIEWYQFFLGSPDYEFPETLAGFGIRVFERIAFALPLYPMTYPFTSTIIGLLFIIYFFPLKFSLVDKFKER